MDTFGLKIIASDRKHKIMKQLSLPIMVMLTML